MPRKALSGAAATIADEQMPTCTGAQIELAQWMVDLQNASNLLEADLAYFISTLSAITSPLDYVVKFLIRLPGEREEAALAEIPPSRPFGKLYRFYNSTVLRFYDSTILRGCDQFCAALRL